MSPKAIVRDMFARAMTFGEYVAYYKLQRSEGLLLRYLSDAYRALRQTVPEASRTEELGDLIAWLGEVTRLVDSSLLDEWQALTGLSGGSASDPEAPPAEHTVTGNARAFRVLVRNAMFRKVELAASDDVDGLAALEPAGTPMNRAAWDAALGAYWDEHDVLGAGPDARGPTFFEVTERGRVWDVRQIIDDPDGNHDWAISASVDLDASDEAGELVLVTKGFARLD